MKLFVHVLIIIIYTLLLGCILYYVYRKFKRKTESFDENNAIKVLQIGLKNTEQTKNLSKLLNKENLLLISTSLHETQKYNSHNIQAQLFKTYTNQLIDIFYYPIHEYSILYINVDFFSNDILDFFKNHFINSKLEFNMILLNSSLPPQILNIMNEKYSLHRKNIFIRKNYNPSNPKLYEIMDSFSSISTSNSFSSIVASN